MAELKTKPTDQSVGAFLAAIPDEARRADCQKIAELMQKVTGSGPVMWGDSIVGFGSYRYTYTSGRSGEWLLTGFSPRKGDLTLYIMSGFDQRDDLLSRLGRHKTGKACLYVKRLSEIDLDVLEELIRGSVEYVKRVTEGVKGGP